MSKSLTHLVWFQFNTAQKEGDIAKSTKQGETFLTGTNFLNDALPMLSDLDFLEL